MKLVLVIRTKMFPSFFSVLHISLCPGLVEERAAKDFSQGVWKWKFGLFCPSIVCSCGSLSNIACWLKPCNVCLSCRQTAHVEQVHWRTTTCCFHSNFLGLLVLDKRGILRNVFVGSYLHRMSGHRQEMDGSVLLFGSKSSECTFYTFCVTFMH